jgi:hypothetical protein
MLGGHGRQSAAPSEKSARHQESWRADAGWREQTRILNRADGVIE